MKKLIPLTLLTFLLLTTAHALFFAGRSVSNYRRIGGIKIDKMGGRTTGIKKINGINFRKKVFDPTEGLVGWWKFDGDINDYSGNNNHASSGSYSVVSGLNQQALEFSKNESISYGLPDTLNFSPIDNFTLCGWFYIIDHWPSGTYPDGQSTILGRGSTGGSVGIGIKSNFNTEGDLINSSFSMGSRAVGYINNSYTSNFNQWYHLCFVYTPGMQYGYVDGDRYFSRDNSDGLSGSFDQSSWNSYGTGAVPGGNGSYISGRVQNVRIYNRALTAEEVQLLYEKY